VATGALNLGAVPIRSYASSSPSKCTSYGIINGMKLNSNHEVEDGFQISVMSMSGKIA
jgi:hypothetical protein